MYRSEGYDDFGVNIPEIKGLTSADIYVPQVREGLTDWIMHSETRKAPEAHWCALCYVRALLLAHPGIIDTIPSLTDMFAEALEYGVYKHGEDGKLKGAYHVELARYIQERFRLPAETVRGLSVNGLRDWILQRRYFAIASVNPDIRYYPDVEIPEIRGGHFVLVTGVEAEGKGVQFILNDSTGLPEKGTHFGTRVLMSDFARFFSGNAIMVKSCI